MSQINMRTFGGLFRSACFYLMVLSLFTVMASSVYAACSNPTADEGEVIYNTTAKVVQFCDGTDWRATAKTLNCGAPSGGSGCSTPTGDEGSIFYNTTHKAMQFCNGTEWMKMGQSYDCPQCETLNVKNSFESTILSTSGANDSFGVSIAADDNYLVVGDNTSAVAYVFDINSGVQLHQLSGSGAGAGTNFGIAVDIDDGKIVVGAYTDDDAGLNSGSAFIFDAATGNEDYKLIGSTTNGSDYFGGGVAIDDGIVLVGAQTGNSNLGAVYVFDVDTGGELRILTASDGASVDFFGPGVDLDGGIAVVGAQRDDDAGNDTGSAYIFNVNTGAQLYKITASDMAAGDRFGSSVSIDGSVIAIGAFLGDSQGSVYIFNTSGVEQRKIKPSDISSNDRFGVKVDLANGALVVGSYYDDPSGGDSGSAYIFDSATGTQLEKLTASDGAGSDYFGRDIFTNGKDVYIGAINATGNASNTGKVYKYSCW